MMIWVAFICTDDFNYRIVDEVIGLGLLDELSGL